jgi:NitT/TauT family transport system ATP-binding protein
MIDNTEDIVLRCSGLSHGYREKRVLHEINLEVIRGEILAIVGETGCGKSTLLRAILGTHPCRDGEIRIASDTHGHTQVRRRANRDCGIVYQHYSLFPFLTALENVTLGLMFDQTNIVTRLLRPFWWRKLRAGHIDQATALLKKLKLGEAMHLRPDEMSGGMRQRVAIAQALIMKPEILLLDEPFGALDVGTREELQHMLLELYMENCHCRERGEPPPYTILIVTHELNEAIYVGDRVVALSRYWNWRELGFDHCPGAAIVYDAMSAVDLPDGDKEFRAFAKQRDEIRKAAFDPKAEYAREQFQDFWQTFRAGKGDGVLKPLYKKTNESKQFIRAADGKPVVTLAQGASVVPK